MFPATTKHFFIRVTDAEAVAMSRYIVKHDGLFLGSSSACNLVACVKLAKQKGWTKGQTVVTILYESLFLSCHLIVDELDRCDSGTRHYSKVSR